MKRVSITTLGPALSALAAVVSLAGCVVAPESHPRPVVVQVQERAAPKVIVENPGPAPAPGMHWVKGYWKWDRSQWVWQAGHWVANPVPPMPEIIVETRPPSPSPVHYWVPGHWVWKVEVSNWSWVHGQWHH